MDNKVKTFANTDKNVKNSESRARLDDVGKYVKSLFFPNSTIKVASLDSFSPNVVKVIVNRKKEYVAKSFPSARSTQAALLIMKDWVNNINIRSGILSPHFIPNIEGDYFPELPQMGKRLYLMEKIDVSPYFLNGIDDFKKMGKAIGKLHQLAPTAKKIPHFMFTETNEEVRHYWPVLDKEERSIFASALSANRSTKEFPTQLNHNDLHPANLLSFHGIPTFLDFDHIILGPKANDLGQTLSAFWIRNSLESIESSLVALVEGYRSVNSIGDEEVSLIPLYALRKICISFTWFKGLITKQRDKRSVELYLSLRQRADMLYLFAKEISLL